MHSYVSVALERSKIAEVPSKKVIFANEVVQFQGVCVGRIETSEEKLVIRYCLHSLVPFSADLSVRNFVRYDFLKEWNNRGFGRTTLVEGDPFACTEVYALSEGWEVIAEIINEETGEKISDYAAVKVDMSGAVLWFNRPVGPIDGYDWIVVEDFFSRYQFDKLGGSPVVSEIPFGFDGAVTFRIDCDEAVSSGRPLFDLFKKYKMPFSMAIKTQQSIEGSDLALMRDVIFYGGSIVGHSHTHAPNWGGSVEAARWEVAESRKVLSSLEISGINLDYVVSPFHQNSIAAIEGLRDMGVRAFVGGIICNDPEFLFARAGQVPGVPGIISHSQQCMFHGDTYRDSGRSIEGYKKVWRQAWETKTFFGYLDHPFSSYWYGWLSEEERLGAHEEFLKYLGDFSNIWRANLVDALRFLEMKSTVRITRNKDGFSAHLPMDDRFFGLPSISINYGSINYELKMGETVGIP